MNWQPLLFLLKLIRLSGGELFEFLIEQDYLTENEAMSFIQQVVEAVDYIHNHHIVHLDIKVSWILLFFSSLMPPPLPLVGDSLVVQLQGYIFFRDMYAYHLNFKKHKLKSFCNKFKFCGNIYLKIIPLLLAQATWSTVCC